MILEALVREGCVGLIEQAIERRRLLRIAREFARSRKRLIGRWPTRDEVLRALLLHDHHRIEAEYARVSTRTARVTLAGYALGQTAREWLHDPDAHVAACVLMLFGVWIAA